MKNYQCKNCKKHIINNGSPSGFNCPNGGFHLWIELGEIGSINYECRKCNVCVKVKRIPDGFSCPSGGHHQWMKL